MHIVSVVRTNGPDALRRFVAPLPAVQFVLDGECVDGQASVVHGSDKIESDGRSCREKETKSQVR